MMKHITLLMIGFMTAPLMQPARGYEKPTRFKLSAEKNTYYAGEPVEFIMTLYNDRDRPIQGDLNPNLYNVWIYHWKVGREFVRYFPRWLQIN
jgi:hypothetical protein